eukprot:jgi/Orpsp1_1/1178974/evm.model.c7180000067434.1
MNITDAKNNENNTSNNIINKTLKQLNASLNGGKEQDKNSKIMSNNTSKRSSMVNSLITSPIVNISNINNHYKEDENDIDNFDDIDCDELESKLDTLSNRHREDVESSSNYSGSPFGTFDDLRMNNSNHKITSSHSLKSISSLTKDEPYNNISKKKKSDKLKHITINGPITIPPLGIDDRKEYKSKSSGLITNLRSKSSSNSPAITPT